jgi:MFS family permease
MSPPHSAWPALKALPRPIWMLGCVSLLMDMSSEIVVALLPAFLVGSLGASYAFVGLIEGLAEATASFAKVFSGALSDYWGKRKGLAVFGYALAAVTKPFFPLASEPGMVLAARVIDRLGKGIRGAPRDALVADIAPADLRGAAYGLRQALDTVGALLGPLAAIALLAWWTQDLRVIFWIAAIPAFLAVLLLAFGVSEPDRPAAGGPPRWPLRRAALISLGAHFWLVIAVTTALMVPRYSQAFFLLRAQQLDLHLAMLPAVYALHAAVFAAAAFPAGHLSDRLGRLNLVIAGFAVLVLAQATLAFQDGLTAVLVAAALWGLHLGLTQGVLAALVADAAPPVLRGTAFGVFHCVTGIAMLASGLMAGGLWQVFGAMAPFQAGAVLALAATVALALIARRS